MLVLSLLMQHLLKTAEERKRSPMVQELTMAFGERFDGEPDVKLLEDAHGARGAEVRVRPLIELGERSLAREVGEFVWRRIGEKQQLSFVHVVAETWTDGPEQRYDVPCPFVGVGARPRHSGARRQVIPQTGRPTSTANRQPATTKTPAGKSSGAKPPTVKTPAAKPPAGATAAPRPGGG